VSAPSGPQVPPHGTLPDRRFSDEFHRLRALALEWISPYYDGEHLRRAADWLLELEPQAAEPMIIAVLTHDMERTVPGGPILDKRRTAWDDPDYNRRHCERSAAVVSAWLRDQGAPDDFVDGVRVPILEHEFGGSPEGNLAQAADSLSWLEVNARLAHEWVARGECDLQKATDKLDWMRDRIQIPRATAIADLLHPHAVDELRLAEESRARPAAS
jgi:hypothetical protein